MCVCLCVREASEVAINAADRPHHGRNASALSVYCRDQPAACPANPANTMAILLSPSAQINARWRDLPMLRLVWLDWARHFFTFVAQGNFYNFSLVCDEIYFHRFFSVPWQAVTCACLYLFTVLYWFLKTHWKKYLNTLHYYLNTLKEFIKRLLKEISGTWRIRLIIRIISGNTLVDITKVTLLDASFLRVRNSMIRQWRWRVLGTSLHWVRPSSFFLSFN